MNDGIEITRITAEDGVRVRKRIDAGADETGTVTLEVTAERDDPATIRLTEPALGTIPREEVELHGDHGAEHWRIDDEATFEREFAAGESYTVVYRVTGVDPDRFETLDAEPVIELAEAGTDADAGAALEGLADRTGSDAVRELVAGERDSLAAGDGPASRGTGAERSLEKGAIDGSEGDPAVDGDGATASDPWTGDSAEASGVDGPDGGAPTDPAERTDGASPAVGDESAPEDLEAWLSAAPSGGVAHVLLQELREGEVGDETAEALRSELRASRSQELRIKHLQNQVSDLAAYAEMLEAFVDEHGTFDAAFETVETEVATLDDEMEGVRSDVDDLSDAVADVDVDALGSNVDDLRGGQDDLEARIERLEDDLEEFKERLSGAFLGLDGSEE